MKNLLGYFIGGAIIGFVARFCYSIYRMSDVARHIYEMEH